MFSNRCKCHGSSEITIINRCAVSQKLCGTLKNHHCSMDTSAEHRSKFAALHQQWWHMDMSEKFLSGTKKPKQTYKQTRWKLDNYDKEIMMVKSSSIKGFNFSISDSRWIKDGNLKLWFIETFRKKIGPSSPQLLNYIWHNNIRMLSMNLMSLPNRMTLSSLNISIFKSLKSHWNTIMRNRSWGRPQTIHQTL